MIVAIGAAIGLTIASPAASGRLKGRNNASVNVGAKIVTAT
jgi:hypothetical protein